MNWGGESRGESYELFILAVGIAVALVIRGSGAWSIDRMLTRDSLPPTRFDLNQRSEPSSASESFRFCAPLPRPPRRADRTTRSRRGRPGNDRSRTAG